MLNSSCTEVEQLASLYPVRDPVFR